VILRKILEWWSDILKSLKLNWFDTLQQGGHGRKMCRSAKEKEEKPEEE
jgi:hypothetical protein